jgi:glutamine synthetase adenylyltransferase
VRRRSTGEALNALRRAGYITPADADALAEGMAFFRAVEQAVKLLDESLEPALTRGGALAPKIARRLGLRARDGQAPADVLFATWERRAEAVRAAFDHTVAPVGLPAPWRR